MLDFKGISVHYGHQDVLTNVTFRVNKGDRVGVVGPNGSGKSTLFKIVLGEMSTDTGELVIECDPRIGWTRQNPEPDSPEETLLEYSLRGIPGLSEMEAEMAELEADLQDPAKMKRYGELQTKFWADMTSRRASRSRSGGLVSQRTNSRSRSGRFPAAGACARN